MTGMGVSLENASGGLGDKDEGEQQNWRTMTPILARMSWRLVPSKVRKWTNYGQTWGLFTTFELKSFRIDLLPNFLPILADIFSNCFNHRLIGQAPWPIPILPCCTYAGLRRDSKKQKDSIVFQFPAVLGTYQSNWKYRPHLSQCTDDVS